MKERRYKKSSKKESGEVEGPNYMAYETFLRLQQEDEEARRKASEIQGSMMATQDSMQDWHDNFAYEQLQRDVENASIIARVKNEALQNPVVIPPRNETDLVQIGNSVTLKYEGDDELFTCTVLGPSDHDTNPSWISYKTPLGQALIGAKKGEKRNMMTPDERTIGIMVKDIQPGNFLPPPADFIPS